MDSLVAVPTGREGIKIKLIIRKLTTAGLPFALGHKFELAGREVCTEESAPAAWNHPQSQICSKFNLLPLEKRNGKTDQSEISLSRHNFPA